MKRLLVIFSMFLAVGPLGACKKKSKNSSAGSSSTGTEDPNQDFAPGSLEVSECIEADSK